MGIESDWDAACTRAERLTAADQPVRVSWDAEGVRGILAVVLAALGPDARPALLIWHLGQGPAHVRELAAAVVGHELAAATNIDPATVDMDLPHIATWVWLTRTWPPNGPWGRPRGIARGLPDPAVDILTEWALRAAKTELDDD